MSILLSVLVVSASFAMLALPGVLALGAMDRRFRGAARWVQGSVLGVAASAVVGLACSYVSLNLFYPVWGLITLVSFWASRRGTARWKIELPVLAVFAALLFSRLGAAWTSYLPAGWDPAFHLLLARKIQNVGQTVSDWTPFAPISLNYPVGMHTLLALIERAAGGFAPMESVFVQAMAWLSAVTAVQILLLTKRLTGDNAAGVLAAMVYGFLVSMGSLDYFGWGGLPNQLGMVFFLGAISFLSSGGRASRRVAPAAICLAGALVTHHHIMLTAGVCVAMVAAVGMMRPAWRANARAALGALLGAGVLTSFYCIPYALKAADFGSTNAMHSTESPMLPWEVWKKIGWLAGGLMLAGGAIMISDRAKRLRGGMVLLTVLGALLGLFIVCSYAIPLLMRGADGRPILPLTPSRFATDASCLLAIFAGVGLAWVAKRSRASVGVVCGLVVIASATIWDDWIALYRPELPSQAYVQTCRWIAANTPAESVVVSDHLWASYLCNRPATYTPVPISEPRFDPNTRLDWLRQVIEGSVQVDPEKIWIVGIKPSNVPGGELRYQSIDGSVHAVRYLPRR